MDFKTIGENIVARLKKLGADEADLQRAKNFNVTARNGEVETLQKSVAKGLGFSCISDLSSESLDSMIKGIKEGLFVTGIRGLGVDSRLPLSLQ